MMERRLPLHLEVDNFYLSLALHWDYGLMTWYCCCLLGVSAGSPSGDHSMSPNLTALSDYDEGKGEFKQNSLR
jgi:hypothetical protein